MKSRFYNAVFIALVLHLILDVIVIIRFDEVTRFFNSADPARGGADTAIHAVTRKIVYPEEPLRQNYDIRIWALQEAKQLRINGLVVGGSPCRKLSIGLELKASGGATLFHTVIVRDTGPDREIPIDSRRRVPAMEGLETPAWAATIARVECLSD